MTGSVRLGGSFRSLWLASAASAVGTGVTITALPLVARGSDESELVLGVVSAAGLLPGLLFALPTGLLADRHDRKRLLIVSDLGRAVVLLVATVLVFTETVGPIALALIAFLIGVGETLYIGSAQALVPMVVTDDQLDHANGRLQAAEDTSREFIGPPLGSLLYALVAWIPFLADAVSYLISASLLSRMPSPPHEPPVETPSLAPAWALFRSSRALKVVASALLVLSFSGAAVLALLVLIVRDELGVGDAWYGPFIAVLALGSTLAGVSAGRLRRLMSAKSSLVTAIALNAWSYMLLGLTDDWIIALGALLVWGFSVTYGLVVSLGIRQRIIPSDLLGRTMGLFRTGVGAGAVLGALGGGVLARATSATTVATIAGLVQLPVILLVLVGLPRDELLTPAAGSADAVS